LGKSHFFPWPPLLFTGHRISCHQGRTREEKLGIDKVVKNNNLLEKRIFIEELVVVPVAVKGNWMAPPVQKEAVMKIADILMQEDPGNKSYYEKNASHLASSIEDKSEEIRKRLQAYD